MPTPQAWYEAAKLALERENAHIEPEYSVKRRDSAGNIMEVALSGTSVVFDPSGDDDAVWVGKFEVIDE
jgi:hypothetical protein